MQEQDRSAVETSGKRDKDLIRQYAQERSESAFAELQNRYARLIFSTCLRETGDRALAEDASQYVFVLLSQRAHTLKRCDTIAGWLYHAARYVSKNLMKQERRRRLHEAQMIVTDAPPIERDNALWAQIEPHFHEALDQIKSADREAVLLRFVQQQSFLEVGARLGIPENTARMRVNRALEKLRSHLQKSGIVVAVGALAVLLETHSSQAAPAALLQSVSHLGSRGAVAGNAFQQTLARKYARRMVARSSLAPLGATLGVFLLGWGYNMSLPQRLNQAEQARLFGTMAGQWSGTLEYADDRTHQHFTYPTTVVIHVLAQGNTLEITADYTGSASVDVTTFAKTARSERFIMQNSGPQNSHVLMGEADLARLREGSFAFQGTNFAQNNETRFRIATGTDTLTIQEEYRASFWAGYQFRNRFTLRR